MIVKRKTIEVCEVVKKSIIEIQLDEKELRILKDTLSISELIYYVTRKHKKYSEFELQLFYDKLMNLV